MTYESLNCCEFALSDAVAEYKNKDSASAEQIAEKYDIPKEELHREFARIQANN
jgi:hypothetical protein